MTEDTKAPGWRRRKESAGMAQGERKRRDGADDDKAKSWDSAYKSQNLNVNLKFDF